MKKEKINSATRLLAATYAFKILTKFSNGTTQRQMQEEYQVRPKQLSLCLTGRKYLGGTDRRAIAKKCKAPDDPETLNKQPVRTSSTFTCGDLLSVRQVTGSSG